MKHFLSSNFIVSYFNFIKDGLYSISCTMITTLRMVSKKKKVFIIQLRGTCVEQKNNNCVLLTKICPGPFLENIKKTIYIENIGI